MRRLIVSLFGILSSLVIACGFLGSSGVSRSVEKGNVSAMSTPSPGSNNELPSLKFQLVNESEVLKPHYMPRQFEERGLTFPDTSKLVGGSERVSGQTT